MRGADACRCGRCDNRHVDPRFHAPEAVQTGDVVSLPDDEARHLTQVLRLKPGASIRIFNGRGQEFDAVVVRARREEVEVRVGSDRDALTEPRVSITLAQALLKADKMDAVVRDAVMMGVAAIQPIVTSRSETTLESLSRGRRLERWQRIAVSSTKQCGRSVVPPVLVPTTFEMLLASFGSVCQPASCFMFVEPGAQANAVALRDMVAEPPREPILVVGPEGGWTPAEVARGSTLSTLVTIRTPTLRADAMAVVAITALLTHWREW